MSYQPQVKYRMIPGLERPTPIEILGETEQFVLLANDRRDKKRTGTMSYFDTEEEALTWAIEETQGEINKLRALIRYKEEYINRLKSVQHA